MSFELVCVCVYVHDL